MSVKAKVAAVLVLCGAGLLLAGRLQRISPAGPERRGPAAASELPYKRVLCMAPAVVEIVYALGAGELVAGVAQHTKWPPEALRRPSCGGYINPNYERMLSLAPDLIITQGAAEDLRRFARDNGIELLSLELTDLESIFTQTRRVGRVLGLTADAERLCARMTERLEAVRARAAGKPRPRVLLTTGLEAGGLSKIYAVGSGTFLSDLIEVAGGVNVVSDLARGYGVVSKEALVARAPEVIVELHGEGGDPAALQEEVSRRWAAFDVLPAVSQGRVHAIAATYALIPGPRVVELAERLAVIFHGGE